MKQEPDPRLERAAVQMAAWRGEQGRDDPQQKERPKGNPEWVAAVFETFRKVFAPARFNQEQEKRLKAAFARADSERAALDAIDLIYNEGERYPLGFHVKEAVDRVNLRERSQQPYDPSAEASSYVPPERGPFLSFRDWYDTQDAEMQARVRRVFPSLKIHAEKAEHA